MVDTQSTSKIVLGPSTCACRFSGVWMKRLFSPAKGRGASGSKTSIIVSQSSSVGRASIRRLVSKAMISASLEL